jgi:oligoendopeptidase F
MTTKNRDQIEKKFKWDVEGVFSSPEEWEVEFSQIDSLVQPVLELKGKLTDATAVAEVFAAEDTLGTTIEKLYLYAHMKEDEDTSVGTNQARMSRVQAKYAEISGQLAWITPEILAQKEDVLKDWARMEVLAPFRRSMMLLLREKPHTLSAEEETLLGMAGEIFSSPHDSFSKLSNADMTFPDAIDSEKKPHEVTNGTFYTLLLDSDRGLRESAFRSIYKEYGKHSNTISSMLAGSSKGHVFNSKVRRFPSSLEASLFKDNIPSSVYTSLIEAVQDALPIFYEYVDLRAECLGLGTDLNMWDVHVPIIPDFTMEVSWSECREWVTESLIPLGEEYGEGVKASFDERWYDVFENKGKRSGAYSTGAYGEKPYMLLNYHGTLNDVFTVAHELGHSMHTRLSHLNQPYRYADYPIFLAEIASITNEQLLHSYLLKKFDDPRLKAYLLNHLCESFRGTLYRQTMFAEFELEIHDRLEKGGALTAESLNEYYFALNAKYYGDKIKADESIALEWARIPHFYYNFYVYKYATGFAAAQIFSQQVLSGKDGCDAYLGFLKSGSSMDPLDTVKLAGVDLSDPAVLKSAFATFKQAIGDLSQLVKGLK